MLGDERQTEPGPDLVSRCAAAGEPLEDARPLAASARNSSSFFA
jgi:hypothetical protein